MKSLVCKRKSKPAPAPAGQTEETLPGELAAPPEEGPDPRRWLALGVVLSASFLGVLDFFIVNVSIPSIQAGLGATFAHVQLMIAGYGLAYAVLLITGGRLGDIFGRKRMFLLGVAGFTAASALCGLAQSPGQLIAARVLQGTTAALMFPQVLSIIQVSFPHHERGLAFAVFGIVSGTASFSGNLLGGLLVQADLLGLGWRPVFLVNVPVGVLALLATGPLVTESRSPRATRLDLVGVALASAGLLLLVYPLVQGREAGWPAWAFVSLAASAPVLGLFLWHEARVSARGGSPLIELSLFNDRVFVAGLLTSFVFYGGLSAFFLTVTLFLQDGLRLTPQLTGIVFAPFAVGFLAASSASVKLAPWLGSRLINLGAALMAAGLALLIGLAHFRRETVTLRELIPVLLVYGVGQGFVIPTLIRTALSAVPNHDAGSASGVLSTVQQVALAVGVALIGSVFFGALGGAAPHGRGFVRALEIALSCNVILLAATFALVFLLPRRVLGPAPVVLEA